ncbi:hypothetical protein, conserved [Babesia bigemina]|uniref:RAP domain-containing protein n=1 Tax=Babesia bigemina TaxID=5866 RepID=A0A061DEY9_BABBI|nr:hypothetical protein, conserved [Babesia bigemina]CDR98110.1 hypothetical protein, conserved [Babesia bigemina]|eukprot:XP_012770296.1 hypothetical protein, conserved [Babesia bigemina]
MAPGIWLRQYHQLRYATSAVNHDIPTSRNRLHDYLKDKEVMELTGEIAAPTEQRCHSICDDLAKLSRNRNIEIELLPEKIPISCHEVENVLLSAPKYPKVSFFPDGYINISLARRGSHSDFIRDARDFRNEEVASSSRLFPMHRTRGRKIEEADVKMLQRNLDANLSDIIGLKNPSDLVEMLRQMHALDLSIKINKFAEVSKKISKGLVSMSTRELVDVACLIKSYLGRDYESGSFLIGAIGGRLDKRSGALYYMSACDILACILPILQMQISFPRTKWTILTNSQLLRRLVTDVNLLDANRKADLFILLTVSNTIVQLSEDLAESTKFIAGKLAVEVSDISDSTMHRLLSVIDIFETRFPILRDVLYRNSFHRSRSIQPSQLASVYLRMASTKDVPKHVKNIIGRRLVEITTSAVIDLYCRHLKDGVQNARQLKAFEWAISKKRATLTMRDMSTILMYHSTHGTSISRLNEVIKARFLDLKSTGNVKHDEVLDFVLSMSLVGLHNDLDVWAGVDLVHLVYSTPNNILVYLGYALLLTGQRNRGIWTILLERYAYIESASINSCRILYDSKHYSCELYEVLKIAQVFGIIRDDMESHLLNRALWVLQHTKSQHYAKVSRQRYQTHAPIEEALNLTGLQYSKGVVVDELYEAPFYITSHKIILDPLRESYMHVTTGLEVGEAHLRHTVWHKQGYRPFPLNAPSLNKFKDTNSDTWNIPALAEFICKVMKMEKYGPLHGKVSIASLMRDRSGPSQSVANKKT